MKHSLDISVSKANQPGIVECRNVPIREKLLRLLFGKNKHLTIIVPGDTVEELNIKEIGKANAHE